MVIGQTQLHDSKIISEFNPRTWIFMATFNYKDAIKQPAFFMGYYFMALTFHRTVIGLRSWHLRDIFMEK